MRGYAAGMNFFFLPGTDAGILRMPITGKRFDPQPGKTPNPIGWRISLRIILLGILVWVSYTFLLAGH